MSTGGHLACSDTWASFETAHASARLKHMFDMKPDRGSRRKQPGGDTIFHHLASRIVFAFNMQRINRFRVRFVATGSTTRQGNAEMSIPDRDGNSDWKRERERVNRDVMKPRSWRGLDNAEVDRGVDAACKPGTPEASYRGVSSPPAAPSSFAGASPRLSRIASSPPAPKGGRGAGGELVEPAEA